MSITVKVGPPTITINRGSTFMVTDQGGEVDQSKPQGLFAEDTRFISTYQIYVNESSWERVTSSAITYYAARLHLTNPAVLTQDGQGSIEARTIAMVIDRQINTGLHEAFHITNFSQNHVRFMLELAMRSDFADIFEVKQGRLTRRGQMQTTWSPERCELVTKYHNGSFSRQLVYHVEQSDSVPAYANGRLIFEVDLDAGGTWEARSTAMLLHQGRHRQQEQHRHAPVAAGQANGGISTGAELAHYQDEWKASCTEISSLNHDVMATYRQSVEDMGGLRLPEHDLGPHTWVPAAGVPWFVTLFGRDSLIASYQTMAVNDQFAVGALRELAKYQAKERDDWRDAQPGKIMHELRHGELAYFHKVPFTPYYGTADATILYLIVLHEAYKWTGDEKLLHDLRETADNCLKWIDKYGDLDGDGFQEWKTFSDQGFNNMGWKDSGEAIVYKDGSQTTQPKGTCELQGYVYDAKLRMAELYDVLGEPQRAKQLREQAAELQRRFDEVFWMEDEGCYALGLDHDKRLIDAVASNTGQCLWTGIVPPHRAEQIVRRLFQPDMWCGWGIRTLSSRNPAYNPYAYQRGSVWPHDNGIIAAGMKRYGFDDEANRIAEATFAAAAFFESFRLPEVFSGVERRPDSFPSQYIGANIPQAWAAGSVFQIIRTILGLRADAPNNILYVAPALPDWLSELQMTGLKVGDDALDLHFWRDGQETRFEVLDQSQGTVQVKVEPERQRVPLTPNDPRYQARPQAQDSGQDGSSGGRTGSGPDEDDGDGRGVDRSKGQRGQLGASGSSVTQKPSGRPHDSPDVQRAEGAAPGAQAKSPPASAAHETPDQKRAESGS